MKTGRRILKTDHEIKIAYDPYRIKIMSIYLSEKKPLTVKQVATLMEEGPSKVHYHVKKLLAIDFLKLHHTENINGIIAKFYIPICSYFEISDEIANRDRYEGVIGNSNLAQFNYLSNKMGSKVKNSTDDTFSMIDYTIFMTPEEHNEFMKDIDNVVIKYRNDKENVREENDKSYSILATFLRNTK